MKKRNSKRNEKKKSSIINETKNPPAIQTRTNKNERGSGSTRHIKLMMRTSPEVHFFKTPSAFYFASMVCLTQSNRRQPCQLSERKKIVLFVYTRPVHKERNIATKIHFSASVQLFVLTGRDSICRTIIAVLKVNID